MMRSLFRRRGRAGAPAVEYEHPAQPIASAFLRAIAQGDSAGVWERLSPETRGALEGLHAARDGLALHEVSAPSDEAIHTLVAPLRASMLLALGGVDKVNVLGVSAARVVDRRTAYVLLIRDLAREGIVSEEDWRPAHLLGFVHESREWVVDLGVTRSLSREAEIPDPLGTIR